MREFGTVHFQLLERFVSEFFLTGHACIELDFLQWYDRDLWDRRERYTVVGPC